MSCGCLKAKCSSPNPVVFQCCDNNGRDVEFISLTEFLPRVTLIAKGVPDDVALEYIRQSCQTLARDTLVLKREVKLDVQAGVRDYYLDNGDFEQIHYVHGIKFGKCGERKIGCSASCHVPLKRCKDGNFEFEPKDKIILTNTPKIDGESQLQVNYFAIPTQNACEVDKLLYDRYHDVVVNGTLSDLLLMRQYDFADPQMAMIYGQRFKQGIAQAKIDVLQQFETGMYSLAYSGRI